MANYGGRGHARRLELARAKGFSSYHAYSKATKAERAAATQRAAAAGAYRTQRAASSAREQVARPPARRRLHDLGGGRQLIRSLSNRELYAFLRRAEQRELRVFGHVELYDGTPIDLWKRGGIDPSYILDELRAAGSNDVLAWLADYISGGGAGGNTGGVSRGRAPHQPDDDDEPEEGDEHDADEIVACTLSSGAANEGIAA